LRKPGFHTEEPPLDRDKIHQLMREYEEGKYSKRWIHLKRFLNVLFSRQRYGKLKIEIAEKILLVMLNEGYVPAYKIGVEGLAKLLNYDKGHLYIFTHVFKNLVDAGLISREEIEIAVPCRELGIKGKYLIVRRKVWVPSVKFLDFIIDLHNQWRRFLMSAPDINKVKLRIMDEFIKWWKEQGYVDENRPVSHDMRLTDRLVNKI